VVGPAIAAIIVFVIAVLTSYPHLIWIVLFLGIWRVLQDYVNAPRIMGKSLEISPLVQILAVLAGGEIAGVVGALISVPTVATFASSGDASPTKREPMRRLLLFPATHPRASSLVNI